MMQNLVEKVKNGWRKFYRRAGVRVRAHRIRILIFFICMILAFCLWMVVNLNRNYNVDIKLPIEVGNIASQKALVNKLPDNVTASVSGRGWNLISTYNHPPHVFININGNEVNLFQQVRQQLSSFSNLTVQKVAPLYLQVKLEQKESRKVPVRLNVKTQFASQYDSLGRPEVTPDSVTVRGAASHIDNIKYWPTDTVSFKNVKQNITTTVPLKKPNVLINVSGKEIKYRLQVAQFTEEQVTLPVEARGFPAGDVVTFSPSSVQVAYRVPLDEYTGKRRQNEFAAYVSYDQLKKDTTGFVEPTIEKLNNQMHLKVRSVDPQQIAYFSIIKSAGR